MKLYLVRSFHWGSPKKVAQGITTRAFTNATDAKKHYKATVKQLQAEDVRYKVMLILAEANQPTTEDWVRYFETGDFDHITFAPMKLIQSVPEGVKK